MPRYMEVLRKVEYQGEQDGKGQGLHCGAETASAMRHLQFYYFR